MFLTENNLVRVLVNGSSIVGNRRFVSLLAELLTSSLIQNTLLPSRQNQCNGRDLILVGQLPLLLLRKTIKILYIQMCDQVTFQ